MHHALTRSVRDSALLLDVAAGPTPGDAYLAPPPAQSYVDALSTPAPRCRVAVSAVRPDGTPVDPQCAAAVADAAALMASLGHDVVEATPPYPIDAMQTVMRVCMPVSMAADVDARLAELGRPLRDDDLEPFTHVLYEAAKGLSGTDVVLALQAVERIGQEVGRFFDGDTLLLTPTIAAPVPLLGHLDTTNVDSMYRNASTYSALTSVANMTGQPAISLPLAVGTEDLPIGIQLVAAFGREDLLLQVAREIEVARPWSTAPDVAAAGRLTEPELLEALRRARFELEVQAADAAQDVRRHVVVAAGAGGAVLLLGDPDVVHPVEQPLDGDASLGARERRAGARVGAVAEREVLARVGALDLEVGWDARSGRGRGSRRR